MRRDFFHTGLQIGRSALKRIVGVFSGAALNGTDYFVDASISQSGDGQSWENAFKTLTEAIAAATTRNDVINVAPGDYDEGAVLNITTQGLRIQGPGPAGGNQNRAMILGTGNAAHAMTINAHEVTVDGMGFSDLDDTYDAIRVSTTMSAYKVTITNCRFDGWDGEYAIHTGTTYDSPDIVIENNVFRSWNTACIYNNATRASIRFNTFLLIAATVGIQHVPTGGTRPDTVIKDNVIRGANSTDTGIAFTGTPTEALFTMEGNSVTNCATPVTLSKYTSWYDGNYWGVEDWRYHPGHGKEAAVARGANGNIFYVDLNMAVTGLDGRCWASAFDTYAAGLAAADTDVGLNRNWAKRNTVYASSDGESETLVLAAEKTDLVGIGYDTGSKPFLTGNFTIGTAVSGFRIFNMGFVGTTTAPVITFPSGMHKWELHDVDIYKAEGTINTAGISATATRNWVMKGCRVLPDAGGARNTIGVTFIGDSGSGYMENCFIEGVEALDIANPSVGTILKDSTLVATNLALDDNSDDVYNINMRFITDAAAADANGTGIVDWNVAKACGCENTSADSWGPIPNLNALS